MHQRYEKCIQNFGYKTERNGKGHLVGLGVAGVTVLQLIPRQEGASMTACCCERGDEPWPFINCMDLLQYVSNNQLLTKDFVGPGSLRRCPAWCRYGQQDLCWLKYSSGALEVSIILGYCATPCSSHTPETSGTSAISQKNEESPQVLTPNVWLSTSALLQRGCFAPRWGYPLTGVWLRSCLHQTDVRLKHLFGQIGWSSTAYAVQQPWRGLNVSFHVNDAVEFQCLVSCACLQMCCYVAYTGSLFIRHRWPVSVDSSQ
jgi:hypothetical protein